MWEQTGASEYRATTYAGSDPAMDFKKDDHLDTANMMFCAASGCNNNLTIGYSNASVGNVTALMDATLGGHNFATGSSYSLYQLGNYSCNCWESHIIDGDHTNGGQILFGDNDYSQINHGQVGYVGPYTLFWIR